ncbi:hypothetical protein [Actinomadura rubrisoli]|uniref:hypothetical protein n=1 Tax=Actinomadura rubrisoli TaxID=2530368 RepID=UPI001404E918|nr:hypothetical protein [Actinomadura rubrisoli]
MGVDAPREQIDVYLLPEFSCSLVGDKGALTAAGRRLVVRLAFEDGFLPRKVLETDLWPDLEPARAGKRLSQLLWRIRSTTEDALIVVDGDRVRLAGDVTIDYWAAKTIARNLLRSDPNGCTTSTR